MTITNEGFYANADDLKKRKKKINNDFGKRKKKQTPRHMGSDL
jgi:hypothetical protein